MGNSEQNFSNLGSENMNYECRGIKKKASWSDKEDETSLFDFSEDEKEERKGTVEDIEESGNQSYQKL